MLLLQGQFNITFYLFLSMQQVYGTSSPAAAAAASYVSPASSFYNTATYPYPSLSSTRSLNPSCKSGSGYLSSPYSSPASPFQSASHPQTSQYSAYASYNTPGTSTFAQSFCTQVKVKKLLINKNLKFYYFISRESIIVVMEVQHIRKHKLRNMDIMLLRATLPMLVHLVQMEV